MFSCQEDEEPFISINQTEFTVSDVGGAKTISIESNTSWTAKSSANWCTITPSSGDASTKTITAKLATNDTYAARSCNIIITAGSISKTLTFNQESNLGLLITQDKYDLSNDAATIEVEVKANVEFDVTISVDWITQAATRSLSTSKLSFDIAKNKSYDNREGTITIKQKGGTLTSTIKVYQSQEYAIIISDKIKDISNNSQTLEIELKTNVDFKVIIPDDAKSWVSSTTTRALRTETLLLNITENKSYDVRTTEIYVRSKTTNINLQDTLTINQNSNTINIISVDKMGALGSILNQTQKDTITIMKVVGEINKADFDVMKSQMPQLRYIDLSEVKCENNKIPDEAIGAKHHDYNRYINTIILPQSVTTIGNYAFGGCHGLSGSLILPGGLTAIGEGAFYGCIMLTGSLNIPDGVTTIKKRSFHQCTGFTGTLTLPSKLTSIEESAFEDCFHFTGSLTIPSGVTRIEDSAFRRCVDFNGSLTFPTELISIGNWAFYKCSGFTGSLNLPTGLTTIGMFAFDGCSAFTGSLTLPDGVTKIAYNTFKDCSGFTGSLILPQKLTTIDSEAFSGCSGFTGLLTFPNELTTIRGNAFENCSGFTGLVFGDNVTSISDEVFKFCLNISGKIIFPISLKGIGSRAFMKTSKITSYRFPHTIPIYYSVNMLDGTNTIEVPKSAVETYKAAAGWKFYNIVGY